jgi:sulfur-carrier protein
MDVLLYGSLSDRIGPRVTVAVPQAGCSVAELRLLVASQHPSVGGDILQTRVRAFVDDAAVADAARVDPAQTVEFLPPVSGG